MAKVIGPVASARVSIAPSSKSGTQIVERVALRRRPEAEALALAGQPIVFDAEPIGMMLFEAQQGGQRNTVNPPDTRQVTSVRGHGGRRRRGHPRSARGSLREVNGKSNQVHWGVIDQ